MGRVRFAGGGGGGVGSDELTATAAKVIGGYTYVGSDTNDEAGTGTALNDATISGAAQLRKGVIAYGKNGTKYTGTMAEKGAATITPSKAAQTIAANQYLTGVQTIAAIPSKYVDISSGATVFLNGTLNKNILPQGFKLAVNGSAAGYSSSGINVNHTAYNGQVITGNSIDLTPFKTLTVVFNPNRTSSAEDFYTGVYVLNTSFKSSIFVQYGSYALAAKSVDNSTWTARTVTVDISNVNQHAFIMLMANHYDDGEGGLYGGNTYVTSIELS